MRTMPLQFLTWGTITAAVGSAVWLSNTDQAAVFCSVGYRATSSAMGIDIPLPDRADPRRPVGQDAGLERRQAAPGQRELTARRRHVHVEPPWQRAAATFQ